MEQSMCFVCRKSAKCFHENLWSMKTTHSQMPICAAIKMIINENSQSIQLLDDFATLCFNCADKINEFDAAQLKMQQIQRELNQMHENLDSTCSGAVCTEFKKCEPDAGDVNGRKESKENDDDSSDSDYSNYSLVSLDKTLQLPKCSICDKSFESYAGLIEHRKCCEGSHVTVLASSSMKDEAKSEVSDAVVEKEKPTCHICNKTYTSRQNLQIHLNSQSVHALRCKYCSIKFVDNESLAEHEKRHTDRPKLQCIECDVIFTAKGTLAKHMLVHTKEKRHQCEFCGAVFCHDTSFKMHIRSHMNDRRSECYMCKFRTLSISQLRVHMRKHTGEKPFKCHFPDCNKYFARPCNRNTHARLHYEPLQKPHKCTTCGAAFARIGKLTEHYQKVHGLQIQKPSTRLLKVNPLPN